MATATVPSMASQKPYDDVHCQPIIIVHEEDGSDRALTPEDYYFDDDESHHIINASEVHDDLSRSSSSSTTGSSFNLTLEIPSDIVCEIIKHCNGMGWSYEKKAQLCLVNKRDWLMPARKSLYRDIHLDYRHEVEQLWTSFRLLPLNSYYVSSLFINGDAAHVGALANLLSHAKNLRRCTFFDFELHSLDHQKVLCDSLMESSNLEALSFQVLPHDFMLQTLKTCYKTLKTLHIYRVNLDRDDGWPSIHGDDQDSDEEELISASPPALSSSSSSSSSELWPTTPPSTNPFVTESRRSGTRLTKSNTLHLQSLENLEMYYTGDVSPRIFKTLIQDRSHTLRTLKICFERSYPITTSADWWRGCHFDNLEELQLKHFHLSVVKEILRSSSVKQISTLTRLSLANIRNPATPMTEEPIIPGINIVIVPELTLEYNSSRFAKGDDVDLESVLESIPPSLHHLEMLEIRSEQLCTALPAFIDRHLIQLKSFPKVTVLANAVDGICATDAKMRLLEMAKQRGLHYSQEDEQNCCLRIKTWSAPSMF